MQIELLKWENEKLKGYFCSTLNLIDKTISLVNGYLSVKQNISLNLRFYSEYCENII